MSQSHNLHRNKFWNTTPTLEEEQEAFNRGMMAAAESSLTPLDKAELRKYFNDRDTPGPASAPQFDDGDVGSGLAGLIFVISAAVAICSFWGVMITAAIGVGRAVLFFISENAYIIGAAAFCIGLGSALFVGKGQPEPNKNTPGGEEWEFYQKQEQGWRQKRT